MLFGFEPMRSQRSQGHSGARVTEPGSGARVGARVRSQGQVLGARVRSQEPGSGARVGASGSQGQEPGSGLAFRKKG
jgi:hypothetical protein